MTITRVGQLTGEHQFLGDSLVDGSTPPTISTAKVRTGSYAYFYGASTDAIGLLVPSSDQVMAGFWLNQLGVFGGSAGLFMLVDNNDVLYRVIWSSANDAFEIYVGGVLEASLPQASMWMSRVDTWMHMGLSFKNGADGFLTLYIDGNALITLAGPFATNPIVACYAMGQASVGSGWYTSAYMDDFYVDTSNGESDSAPGAKRFLPMLPTVNGASSEFTPIGDTTNVACIDDGVPDGDTTYNKTLVTGKQDLYEMANITLPPEHEIRAVIPFAIARKGVASTDAKIKVQIFDGANTANSSEQAVNYAYNTYFGRFPLQPDGTVWVVADVNGMQMGYESAGAF